MSKLIVTRWKERMLTALITDGRCRSFQLETEKEQSLLGTILIGKVKNVVKNINAAFLDLGSGQIGYYSLTENPEHFVVRQGMLCITKKIKQGDELVVQIEKDAVKTKAPVLTANLTFTGKYLVLTLGKTRLGFSAKIKNGQWKEEVKGWLEPIKEESCGIIVRTNAEQAEKKELEEELAALLQRKNQLLEKAPCRTCYSVLEAPIPSYLQEIRDSFSNTLQEIITDIPEYYQAMLRYLQTEQPKDTDKLIFYEDKLLPLEKLYRIEAALDSALAKRVWLKSGGYLVIEPTEALTVIDVNTGKYAGKKNAAETILKINLEAALETAHQLCLRNLSGIIIVDFIDMVSEEDKRQLLHTLEAELKKDPVKTVLVEMTRLGLVEITRKKVRKPLHEML